MNKSHFLKLSFFVFAFAFMITAALLLMPTESTMAATTSRAVQTGLDPAVMAALTAFYTSTNGPTWAHNDGWLTASDPCTWYGLTCTNGKLSQISLPSNGLSGNLPTEIGNFPDLTILNVVSNQIGGLIPTQLGSLSNLVVLNLSANLFTGSIPTQLGNLTKLTDLYIYANNLTGGSIPTSLGNLVNLQKLQLSDDNLGGGIPAELSNLTKLENFSLQNNLLTGTIPDLSAATNLNFFRIDSNSLSGVIPSWLFSRLSITVINISKNQLSGQIPPAIGNLTLLTDFQVAYNQLDGDIPLAITTLSSLQTVATGFNKLTASNPTVKTFLDTKNPGWDQSQTIAPVNVQIGKVTSTTIEINWDAIPYTGNPGYYEVGYATTPGGPYSTPGCSPTANKTVTTCIVGGLTQNTPYYFVVRSFTPAHDIQQNALLSGYSQEVSSLTFPATICDSAATDYSECQALWLLYTNTNGANWTNHTDWLLTNTPCTWYGVTCNGGGSVTQLALGTNHLAGTIPPEIGYLTNLQQLSLNGNTLTGSIPAQLGSLANLQTLNLSANQLSGSIPTQLGGLSNLVDLSLGGNQLSGSIPTQLGSLTHLQTLNLSNNAFSGNIPTELSVLTNVLTLDVSFNLLTASDANLILWLNSKQPTWASTQTIAPTGVQTAVISTNTIRVSWTPITYTADGGYYEVGYSSTINGPFSQSGCTTADKTVTTCDVHNLGYNTAYYFAVRTSTSAHGLQQNVLLSGFSTAFQGTTPTNDNFANSIIIPKPPYTNTLSNAVATLENLEQKGACEGTTNIAKTIWYQYTAVGTESVTFTVSGSTVVKGISIWTGSSLGNLTQVGCSTGATASASLTTITGITYYIRLGSSNGVSSAITLQVTAPHGAPLRNAFVTQTPTLTWNRVTNATRYEIQVSKLSTFTTSVFPIASVPAGQLVFTTPQLTPGVYYWRVRAIRGTAVGAWSAFDSFVIQGP